MVQIPPVVQPSRLPIVADPAVIFPAGTDQLERILFELIQLAESRQIQVVASGGITKASMLRLVRRVTPGERLNGVTREEQWPMLQFVRVVAVGAGLLYVNTDSLLLPTKRVLAWLQHERGERVWQLLEGWHQADWDELHGFEGVRILPRPSSAFSTAKQSIQHIVSQLPDHAWVAIDQFIEQLFATAPHFLREDLYDPHISIRNRLNQQLDGSQDWNHIEGLWLRVILTVTWRWLGLIEVGVDQQRKPIAFRLTALGMALLKGSELPEAATEFMTVQPNFEVLVPPNCLPYVRFQLRRVAEEVGTTPIETYRLTRKSVLAAMARGIEGTQIERFLEHYSGKAVPQNVIASLREWFGEYGRVTLREALVLETDAPSTLERLRHDKRLQLPAATAIGERMLVLSTDELGVIAERIRNAGYGLAVEAEPASDGELRLTKRELADALLAIECYHVLCNELDIEVALQPSLRRRLQKHINPKAATHIQTESGQIRNSLRRRLRDA